MVIEIEVKAHVADFEALRQLLLKKADYKNAFTKEDSYWFSGRTCPEELSPGRTPEFPLAGLRVRREKRSFADGKEESSTFVTYKIKEVRDGMEINDEREFEVCSPSGRPQKAETPVFDELLRRLGLTIDFSKRKRGWAFSHNEINAELAEVEGLGWFVELEIIADNNREETVTQSRKKLIDFLDSLGIKREAIESRFYSELLRSLCPDG